MNNRSTLYAIVVALGLAMAGLVTALVAYIAVASNYATQLENVYMRSFYELSGNLNDLEIDISKLIATNDAESQMKVLTDIYNNCNIANTNISNMPINSSSISEITKFVNKLGGFSYSLMRKLENNQDWTSADINSINELHTYALNVMYELNNFISTFTFDFSMLNNVDYNNEETSKLNETFDNIQGSNSKVPTLIYDGPFADSVINPEIKGLPQEEVTREEAHALIEEKLSNMYEIQEIKYDNETNGIFATYNFRVKTKELSLFVQITKRGGMLLEITSIGSGGDQDLSKKDSEDLAKTFARNLGYNDLYPVWSTVNGSIAYVNLAPIVNGVIYYPDLIKVKIDRKLANVTGWEAKNYAFNNTIRTSESPSITLGQAEAKVSPLLTIIEKNKAVIPLDFKGEKLTYEFVCTWKNYTYYVYIDAHTGQEVNILRIIKTNNGDLIM